MNGYLDFNKINFKMPIPLTCLHRWQMRMRLQNANLFKINLGPWIVNFKMLTGWISAKKQVSGFSTPDLTASDTYCLWSMIHCSDLLVFLQVATPNQGTSPTPLTQKTPPVLPKSLFSPPCNFAEQNTPARLVCTLFSLKGEIISSQMRNLSTFSKVGKKLFLKCQIGPYEDFTYAAAKILLFYSPVLHLFRALYTFQPDCQISVIWLHFKSTWTNVNDPERGSGKIITY